MANENETIEDILAELRKRGECRERSPVVYDYADRIEVAWRRETQAHKKELETRDAVIQTEVAAREAEREAHKREMKEAVRRVSRVAEEMTRGTIKGEAPTRKEVDEWAVRLYDIIDITLLAPARNCDRFNSGNAERDAEMAWDAITSEMDLQVSDLTDREIAIIKEAMRGFVWLFTTAGESEVNNDTRGDT